MADSGNISPVDVKMYVDWELQKRQVPLNRLLKSEKDQEVQLSRYGNLQSLLQTFQNNLQALNNTFNAVNFQAISSNSSAVTAQITSNTVAPISHTISVTQLALAESQISAGQTTNNTGLNITDTLTIAVGSNSFGVTVGTGDSLQNIRDNINSAAKAANLGVTATLFATNVSGTPQYQLIISSNQTGVANAVSVTDTNNNALGFSEQTKAQDSVFTVDNQSVQRSTNMVNDVLDGVNLNLLAAGTAPVTLNISPLDAGAQNANITTAIQAVLNSYNDTIAFLDKSQINPATSNESFPLIKLTLQNALAKTITGSSSQFNSLANIGIVLQPAIEMKATIPVIDKDGKEIQKEVKYYSTGQLALNTDINLPLLATALQNNSSAVQSLLTNTTNGIFNFVSNSLLDPLVGQVSITIKSNMATLQQRENVFKQKIADEQLSLEKEREFYTNKYSALNVLLEKLQTQAQNITKQLDASIFNNSSR